MTQTPAPVPEGEQAEKKYFLFETNNIRPLCFVENKSFQIIKTTTWSGALGSIYMLIKEEKEKKEIPLYSQLGYTLA